MGDSKIDFIGFQCPACDDEKSIAMAVKCEYCEDVVCLDHATKYKGSVMCKACFLHADHDCKHEDGCDVCIAREDYFDKTHQDESKADMDYEIERDRKMGL